MKKLLLTVILSVCFATLAFAQGQTRTYYDAEKTKPKEVYSLKTVVTMNPDNPAASGETTLKHGPYFLYYENGKLKASGQYKDDQKSGEWKYYDESGKLLRTEQYQNGNLVKP